MYSELYDVEWVDLDPDDPDTDDWDASGPYGFELEVRWDAEGWGGATYSWYVRGPVGAPGTAATDCWDSGWSPCLDRPWHDAEEALDRLAPRYRAWVLEHGDTVQTGEAVA
ncbi:hypothetical protein [Roseomonas genomospecies 6]|uniref:Uncharacterized protein n=1 Tax=Roseomonas genomospecies 6 TaxID=214106 RepID=A0A9W7TYG7_9PROT|nr:hypothetical protein [Roseomonas genomospecies 6]KAA0679579.1 hypothetical protein DS843_16735 [Roseomonas genomospecies 6]